MSIKTYAAFRDEIIGIDRAFDVTGIQNAAIIDAAVGYHNWFGVEADSSAEAIVKFRQHRAEQSKAHGPATAPAPKP